MAGQTVTRTGPLFPAPRAGLQAVVFDCDGVLVDSERITNGVIAQMLREQGLDIDTDGSIALFMGKTVKELLPSIEEMTGKPLPPNWFQEFLRRRDEGLSAQVEPIDGIAEVIAHLHSHRMPFAVASGADCAKMRLTLGRCKLLPSFESVMFGRDMVPNAKPAPDVYEMAMKHLGVSADHVVVIEDSPTGIAAGVAAGAAVYGYAAMSDPSVLRAAGASVIFTDMAELPALLAD